MLVGMQISLAVLNKKAIDAALKSDWETAVEINTRILDVYPENIEAKIRLGRALIQTKKFDKAKKVFREVLKVDPINTVALKNFEIAKKGRVEHKILVKIDTKSLLIEPGTTREMMLEITAKGVTSNDFYAGEILTLKPKKHEVEVYKIRKDSTVLVGVINNEEIVQKLNSVIEKSGHIQASYIRGKEKHATVLVKSSIAIFKSERQDIRPYIKKGIDDQDMELEEEEEVVVEE